jgi:hypothetical protein
MNEEQHIVSHRAPQFSTSAVKKSTPVRTFLWAAINPSTKSSGFASEPEQCRGVAECFPPSESFHVRLNVPSVSEKQS